MSVVMEACATGVGVAVSTCVSSYDGCNGINVDSGEAVTCNLNKRIILGNGQQNGGQGDQFQSTESELQCSLALADNKYEKVARTEQINSDAAVMKTEPRNSVNDAVRSSSSFSVSQKITSCGETVGLPSQNSCYDIETSNVRTEQGDNCDRTVVSLSGTDVKVNVDSVRSSSTAESRSSGESRGTEDIDDAVEVNISNSCKLENGSDDVQPLNRSQDASRFCSDEANGSDTHSSTHSVDIVDGLRKTNSESINSSARSPDDPWHFGNESEIVDQMSAESPVRIDDRADSVDTSAQPPYTIDDSRPYKSESKNFDHLSTQSTVGNLDSCLGKSVDSSTDTPQSTSPKDDLCHDHNARKSVDDPSTHAPVAIYNPCPSENNGTALSTPSKPSAVIENQSGTRRKSSTLDCMDTAASSASVEPCTRSLRSRNSFTKYVSQSHPEYLQSLPGFRLPQTELNDCDNNTAPLSCRPIAKLLQDTGILLASEKVFKYLMEVQKQKIRRSGSANLEDDRLLTKLESSYSSVASRNLDFKLLPKKRCVCGFHSESSNVLRWHQQCGNWTPGTCCMCNGEFSYKRRYQFEKHMLVEHKQCALFVDRPAVYSCQTCEVDLSTRAAMYQHELVCRKKFLLAKNLMPHLNHEDIPIKPTLVRSAIRSDSVVNFSSTVAAKKSEFSSLTSTKSSIQSMENKLNVSGGKSLLKPIKPSGVIQGFGKANGGQTMLGSPLIISEIKQPSVLSVKKMVNSSGQMYSVLTKNASPVVEKSTSKAADYHICPLCSGFVKDEASLEIHMRVVHRLLSTSEVTVCWMCIDKIPVPTRFLLSHIAEKHDVTMLTMLQRRQCSLCPSLPKMRNASAFESHMITAHCVLFPSTETLWQNIEKSLPRRSHVKHSPDGTLLCQLCSSSFISRAFLCRHSNLVHMHGGLGCNCIECHPASASGTNTEISPSTKSRSAAAMVVISDDEDDGVASKRLKLSNDANEKSLQSLLARNGSIMDKIEEVLEIDGETVVIVQQSDYDDDNVD